jgi:hypothetical protein
MMRSPAYSWAASIDSSTLPQNVNGAVSAYSQSSAARA